MATGGDVSGDTDALSSYTGHDDRKGLPLLLSRLISTVLSPLLMPLLAVSALLFGTVLSIMPARAKLYYTVIILLDTCIVPILCIGLLHSLGVIKGLLLATRRDRVLPLLITALCYVLCAFMVRGLPGSLLVSKFLLAGSACITVAFIVTFYWKISIHMLGAGGTLAMLCVIQYLGLADFLPLIVLMVAACGALASARLYLGAHTPLQVATGFTGGFVVALVVIMSGGWTLYLH